jgi:hypothetical protein
MRIVSPLILSILTLNNKNVLAMALWPFVVYKDKKTSENTVIQNHEKIHHRQQIELLILPFYIWYFIEYWVGMFKCKFKHEIAYRNISFEMEAYDQERNKDYLKHRPYFSNWKYFKLKIKKNAERK